ncbi:MAG: hypothetical protein J6K37_02510 [Lachnospiraceae bacterium]|nr:hypothetical protein [Lachnospiraceae bacterium]
MDKKIKVIVFIGLVLGALIIILAILHSVWTKHQEEQQKEQEIRMERLERYSRSLCISGDVVVDENQVTISNFTYDEKEMVKWVSLHNVFYPEDTVTIESLMKAFDEFCTGMNESNMLEAYRDRMIKIKVRAENVEIFIYSHDYDLYIIECLKEINENNSLSEATVAEMEEVCPLAAERLYQEVICLEKSED